MQVTETLSDGLKRGYTIVVPASDIEGKRTAKLAKIGRDLRLPGFRPGKVPANLVRQRFGGAVLAEVLEESVNDATQQVLSDRGLRSAGQPKVEVTSLDAAQDLEFKVELELLPEITPPDMSDIALTRLRAEPPPETIDKALADLARRQRTLEPVEEDRAAEVGDVLTIDYEGRVDDVAFPGGTARDADVDVAGPGFIPGFTEQLTGLRAGETRTLEVTFPADYGTADLAGKHAMFAVTAKALKRAVVPPVDDELGKQLGFDGLEEVRVLLTRQAQREYDQLSRLRLKRQLLDALAERAQFAVPSGMVEAEFAQIWQRVEADRTQGAADAEDSGKDDETLKAEYRAIAERRVRLGLLLSEIGRANAITVSNDELARAMRAEAGRYPGQEQQVLEFFRKNPQAVDGLRGPIFEEKVVDFVLELAQVTDQTVTPEELAQAAEATGAEGAPASAHGSEVAAGPTPDAENDRSQGPDHAAHNDAADPGQMAGTAG